MSLLHRQSLGQTVDSISEPLFFGRRIPESERKLVAPWIAHRQGLPGSYANTFAPTEKDTLVFHLFTGEAIRTRVGIAHILGEETCRVLSLLNVKDPFVAEALARAVSGLAGRIEEAQHHGGQQGFYCCGPCSAAFWRNLAGGLFPHSEEQLRQGLAMLMNLRAGGGKWRRFPFFYTCLVLTEIGPGLAKAEMQYAAPYWHRNLKKLSQTGSSTAQRRSAVGRRLLAICES